MKKYNLICYPNKIVIGQSVRLKIESIGKDDKKDVIKKVDWSLYPIKEKKSNIVAVDDNLTEFTLNTDNIKSNTITISATIVDAQGRSTLDPVELAVTKDQPLTSTSFQSGLEHLIKAVQGNNAIQLKPNESKDTNDLILYAFIKCATNRIRFGDSNEGFNAFVDKKLSERNKSVSNCEQQTDFYLWLKKITEEFLTDNACTLFDLKTIKMECIKNQDLIKGDVDAMITAYFGNDDKGLMPYLKRVKENIGDFKEKLSYPFFIELIWSFWLHEGMQKQTINAISLRFQNKSNPTSKSQLRNLSIDTLRPMSNILFGYLQDEYHRLTIRRVNYEFLHQYGLKLKGKALENTRPIETRSKFLRAFNHLLYLAASFYKDFDNKTISPDAFPLRNGLKEVHLILSSGATNQYKSVPFTSRVEMLIEQWLLSRPELGEFLGNQVMTPYEEKWMSRVDTMKKMQGWSDVSITHYYNLARWGEQLLLSVRFGDWNNSSIQAINASNWAISWRNEIQEYMHAYFAVTGVDLYKKQNKVLVG